MKKSLKQRSIKPHQIKSTNKKKKKGSSETGSPSGKWYITSLEVYENKVSVIASRKAKKQTSPMSKKPKDKTK